jgi:hypothetical protein
VEEEEDIEDRSREKEPIQKGESSEEDKGRREGKEEKEKQNGEERKGKWKHFETHLDESKRR